MDGSRLDQVLVSFGHMQADVYLDKVTAEAFTKPRVTVTMVPKDGAKGVLTSSAVRIGDILYLSGQMGFRDDGTLAVWQTNGQQIQSISVLGSAPSVWHSSGMGDFNGDGTTDLLFRNDNGDIAQWIINNNQIQSIRLNL